MKIFPAWNLWIERKEKFLFSQILSFWERMNKMNLRAIISFFCDTCSDLGSLEGEG